MKWRLLGSDLGSKLFLALDSRTSDAFTMAAITEADVEQDGLAAADWHIAHGPARFEDSRIGSVREFLRDLL